MPCQKKTVTNVRYRAEVGRANVRKGRGKPWSRTNDGDPREECGGHVRHAIAQSDVHPKDRGETPSVSVERRVAHSCSLIPAHEGMIESDDTKTKPSSSHGCRPSSVFCSSIGCICKSDRTIRCYLFRSIRRQHLLCAISRLTTACRAILDQRL